MVSGLVVALSDTPYFSRVKNNHRAVGSNRFLVSLLSESFHDPYWHGKNYHIMPEQLITWASTKE